MSARQGGSPTPKIKTEKEFQKRLAELQKKRQMIQLRVALEEKKQRLLEKQRQLAAKKILLAKMAKHAEQLSTSRNRKRAPPSNNNHNHHSKSHDHHRSVEAIIAAKKQRIKPPKTSPAKRRKVATASETSASSSQDTTTTASSEKRRGDSNFAWDYSSALLKDNDDDDEEEVEEETGIPCSNWPQCKYQKSCKFSHPTQAQLRKRGGGPLRISDLSRLIKRFKNNTIPLKRLQLLVSRRLNRAAKLCRVKPPNTNNDAILKTMGLPDIRAILTSFAKEGEQTKVTSRKDFNNLANKGYFAILKLGNEFLIRFYETRSHNSSSSSAKHKPAPRRQNNKQPHSGQQQQQQQTGRGTAANNSSSSRRTRTRGYYGDEDDYVNNARPLSLLNRKIAFCEAGIGGRARGRHGEEQPSNLVILDAQALSDRNKGFTMLKSMGWREGFGLGSKGQGVVEPPPVRFTMTRGF